MSLLIQDVDPENKQYQYIQEMTKANPVMVFAKSTCNYCKMAKQALDGTGFNYMVEEIENREDCQELQDMFQKLTGARSVSVEYKSRQLLMSVAVFCLPTNSCSQEKVIDTYPLAGTTSIYWRKMHRRWQ